MEKRRKIKVKAATSDKKINKLILHEKFLVKKKFILNEKYLIEKKLRPVENVIDFKNTSKSNLEIRNVSKNIEIVASGTSCRHQIYDGTKRKARHPITVLCEALT